APLSMSCGRGSVVRHSGFDAPATQPSASAFRLLTVSRFNDSFRACFFIVSPPESLDSRDRNTGRDGGVTVDARRRCGGSSVALVSLRAWRACSLFVSALVDGSKTVIGRAA